MVFTARTPFCLKFRARDLIERVGASGKCIEHGRIRAVNPLYTNPRGGTKRSFHAPRLDSTLNYLFLFILLGRVGRVGLSPPGRENRMKGVKKNLG